MKPSQPSDDWIGMTAVVELDIPARPEFLGLARLIATAAAAQEPVFSEDRLDDLRLAVSEVCTNAMEADLAAEELRSGRASRGMAGHIRVQCLVEGGRIEVEVRDEGTGFDPAGLLQDTEALHPRQTDSDRGLGIPLVRILTDEVDFRPGPDGTAVRMVLYAVSPATPSLP